MAEERVQRRLAAILAADIVGYSRLMGADEEGTLTRMKTLRKDVIDPKIEEYSGRIFKTTGDGILAEFPSAVEAVRHAVDVQRTMAGLDEDIPEDNRIAFRIGISLGDVMVDGDDLFGNGVNVASRMEGLAEPGGICVSGNVHEHIGRSLDVAFEDLGEQSVKNIDQPVRCYRVQLEADGKTKSLPPISDKPALAVLPFENMSGDPEQEYFADGLTEDIITALSLWRSFPVIARNSTFAYKGTSPDMRQVGKELGARYILEGSVRKGGDRIRITAQLIDALSGHHVWADRYDRDLHDIFAVQDEITEAIAGAVAPSFVSAEAKRLERKAPENFDSWDYAIRGNWHLWRLDKNNLSEARRNFEAAIDLDPSSSTALGGLALACSWQVVWGWAENPDETRDLAYRMARQAVAANEFDAWAHYAQGQVFLHRRRLDEAERATLRALELNPNLAVAQAVLSSIYAWMGQYDAAIETVEKAERLNPRDPSHAWYALTRICAAFVVGRYEEQVEWAQKMTEEAPDHPAGWRFLATGYGSLGRQAEAHVALQGLLRVVPHYTIELARTSATGVREEDLERLLDGLRKVGVPE